MRPDRPRPHHRNNKSDCQKPSFSHPKGPKGHLVIHVSGSRKIEALRLFRETPSLRPINDSPNCASCCSCNIYSWLLLHTTAAGFSEGAQYLRVCSRACPKIEPTLSGSSWIQDKMCRDSFSPRFWPHVWCHKNAASYGVAGGINCSASTPWWCIPLRLENIVFSTVWYEVTSRDLGTW